METNTERLPHARMKEIVTSELADEVLVYDLSNHKAR